MHRTPHHRDLLRQNVCCAACGWEIVANDDNRKEEFDNLGPQARDPNQTRARLLSSLLKRDWGTKLRLAQNIWNQLRDLTVFANSANIFIDRAIALFSGKLSFFKKFQIWSKGEMAWYNRKGIDLAADFELQIRHLLTVTVA